MDSKELNNKTKDELLNELSIELNSAIRLALDNKEILYKNNLDNDEKNTKILLDYYYKTIESENNIHIYLNEINNRKILSKTEYNSLNNKCQEVLLKLNNATENLNVSIPKPKILDDWQNSLKKLERETNKMHKEEPDFGYGKNLNDVELSRRSTNIVNRIEGLENLIKELDEIRSEAINTPTIQYLVASSLNEKTNTIINEAQKEKDYYRERAFLGPTDARKEVLKKVKISYKNANPIQKYKLRKFKSKQDTLSRLALEEMLKEAENKKPSSKTEKHK